jgi:uncharacterized protein (TIGR03437 family)
MLKGVIVGLFLPGAHLIAQTLVGAGYLAPVPVSVAPGQIATFYVSGLYLGIVPTPAPPTSPTPSTGLTATLQQNGNSIPAPIQSLLPISLCPNGSIIAVAACGSLMAITVQIPYELVPICPLCAQPLYISATPPELVISLNGQPGTPIQLNPVGDQVHALTACDVALAPPSAAQPNLTGLPCTPLVTHSNGTPVSASSPANVGEALTAWVFGLGQTTPSATTGQPAKAAAPTAETFYLGFNYQVNALPEKPYTGEPDVRPPQPLYAGLAPGFVGLYQVNFIVPPAPPNGLPQCTGAAEGTSIAQSNLTVSIGGQFSFDGAGICVATQIPVD